MKSDHLPIRILGCAILVVSASICVCAQAADPGLTPAVEQSETFRDTLVRMKIRREEEQHQKLVDKAEQIADLTGDLLRKAEAGRLPRSQDKKIRDIEKFAKQIRTEFGGGGDAPLEEKPASLSDALRQLQDLSERLKTGMSKTSRRVVSAGVISDATEIIALARILRGYVN